MIKKLHQMGVRSSHMYAAGLASVGLAFSSWLISRNTESAGLGRADRWGIFVGEWAPTLFAMGVALRLEETHRDLEEQETFGATQGERIRSHAGV